MFNKMITIACCLFFIYSCDEDYVNSLSFVNPTVSLELVSNLDDFYLGESVENIEIILKVEESPSVSNLAFSINYDPEYFQSDTIVASAQAENLFYNISSNAIIDDFFALTDSTFEINVGFTNNQDTTYTYGNGEVARLFLNGRNVETAINLSIDNVLSYDFDSNIDDWYVEGITIGKPVPQIYLDNFIYNDNSGLLAMDIDVLDLPRLSDAQISINYNSNTLSFVEESNPDGGDLIDQGFDLNLVESEVGSIIFDFSQSDGNEDNFISGSGSLVTLKFNVLAFDLDNDLLDIDFNIDFSNSIFDICGECVNPSYNERYDYDISFWNSYDFSGFLFGCTDVNALNYSNSVIIDNDSCIYE